MMIINKLAGNQLLQVKSLYEAYNSNQAVIFSIFENQFLGSVYVNDPNDIKWAVLQTPFLQHFIAGTPTGGCTDMIENILFNIILSEQTEKEIVTFSDSDKWDSILDAIYAKHNGDTDGRKIFAFSKENYGNIIRPATPSDIKPILEKCKNIPFSLKDSWTSKLLLNGQIVSSCNAIMQGMGKAEIDISTDESFRGKGYATLAATLLIDKLLEDGLEPTWSAWPHRVESQQIALKLGFIPQPDAKAWIWLEEEIN